jgi:hypothetical protein
MDVEGWKMVCRVRVGERLGKEEGVVIGAEGDGMS